MPDTPPHIDAVWTVLPEPRLVPYVKLAQDKEHALELYAWSTRTASACFEVVAYLEVILRNALDKVLMQYFREDDRGIPWFLLMVAGGEHVTESVSAVRLRLQAQERSRTGGGLVRDSRHQIVAGLSFGFWSGLLGPRYEELWRDCLYRAFPNSSGRRKDVAAAVERVRQFRNRLAHHDSMIKIDVPFEVRQVIEVVRFIDADAARWLDQHSNAMTTYAQRPGVAIPDTVLVAARDAWPLYDGGCRAYVCQPGRAFRDVQRIAFYADSEIKRDIPSILHRRDNVEWTLEEAARLEHSADRLDRKLASVIQQSRAVGWTDGRYQVFLLTQVGDPAHRELQVPLPHQCVGRGTAFTRRQRYLALHALETAKSTADLL